MGAAVLDEVIEDLRRMLAKCDEARVGSLATIYIDLAMHMAIRERSEGRANTALLRPNERASSRLN